MRFVSLQSVPGRPSHRGLGLLPQVAFSLALCAVLAPAAPAQQSRIFREGGSWVEEISGTLPAGRNLRLTAEVGSVKVQGGAAQEISYVIRKRAWTSSEAGARRQLEAFHVTAGKRGDTAWMAGEWGGGSQRKFSADFSLQVPRNLENVKLETQGGSVEVDDIAGRVEASSGGGSLKLDEIGGAVKAGTGGGSIEVGSAGGDLSLETGGGSIRVQSAKGKIVAQSGGGSVVVVSGLQAAFLETGGGSIEVQKCGGQVKASTGGGSVDVGEVDGPAQIATGGGSIRLASAKGPVQAQTGGGSIELRNLAQGARAETGGGSITAQFVAGSGIFSDSLLETPSGDITVYLAPNLAVTVYAWVELGSGHNIRSDFPELRTSSEGGDYGPKRITAEGKLNGGGPVLKVRTNSGDIQFRRLSR